mmetsp:Transcript_24328/g.50912  ORF Transcript_24328/g.50912 Transcript_24328/m.50912 type:complete len:100 (+) Transcript_24328:95-394(+)
MLVKAMFLCEEEVLLCPSCMESAREQFVTYGTGKLGDMPPAPCGITSRSSFIRSRCSPLLCYSSKLKTTSLFNCGNQGDRKDLVMRNLGSEGTGKTLAD